MYLKYNINQVAEEELNKIISYSIQYYKKFILPSVQKRKTNELEKKAIIALIKKITILNDVISAEEYQEMIYSIGKELFTNDLRQWFIVLYQILFGSDNGPRLGSFFNVYGKKNVLNLLEETIH